MAESAAFSVAAGRAYGVVTVHVGFYDREWMFLNMDQFSWVKGDFSNTKLDSENEVMS